MYRTIAIAAVLALIGSTAMAGWGDRVVVVPGPVPVVTYYAPTPTYVYPPAPVPTVTYYSGPAYSAAAPTYAPSVVAYPPVYYGRPVVVRPKVYVYGQPVRNVIRAITP